MGMDPSPGSHFHCEDEHYIWADVVAGQKRDSDAQMGIHAILKFKGCPLGEA